MLENAAESAVRRDVAGYPDVVLAQRIDHGVGERRRGVRGRGERKVGFKLAGKGDLGFK